MVAFHARSAHRRRCIDTSTRITIIIIIIIIIIPTTGPRVYYDRWRSTPTLVTILIGVRRRQYEMGEILFLNDYACKKKITPTISK